MSRTLLGLTALAVAGVVVGAAGTGAHRYEPAWGLTLCIVLVVSAATFARAWRGWWGLMVFAQVWVATVLTLYFYHGPGDSILILSDKLGLGWMIGGSVATVVPAFLPRRLMTRQDDGNR